MDESTFTGTASEAENYSGVSGQLRYNEMGQRRDSKTFSRRRHIDVLLHFESELMKKGEVTLCKIGTDEMLCDYLTKFLEPENFQKASANANLSLYHPRRTQMTTPRLEDAQIKKGTYNEKKHSSFFRYEKKKRTSRGVERGLVALHQTECNISSGYNDVRGPGGSSPDHVQHQQWQQ